MQVSIETTTGLERKLTVTVPFQRFESQVETRIAETAKRVSLPGFRPGKVPVREVKRRFGPGIRAQVIEDTVQSSFTEAVQQEQLRPAAPPRFELATPDIVERPGDDLRYVATFEVLPLIELRPLEHVKVENATADVTDADLDRMIERLRSQRQTFEAREGKAAAKGDVVKLDFEGRVGGEPFEGGKAEGATVEIGAGRVIADFESALIGMRAGESKDAPVKFPDDYGAEALKGKEAVFSLMVHEVREAVLPALDESFFASFGVNSGGVDAFRAEVRKSMERELDTALRGQLKRQVLDGLAEVHNVQLPIALVAREIERMRHDATHRLGMVRTEADHNHEREKELLPDELFRESSERRVRAGLVMAELIRTRELKPEAEKVRAMIRSSAAQYDQPDEVVNWIFSNQEQLSNFEQLALEEQLVDLVLGEATVTEVAKSYDEVITPPKASGATASAAEQ